MKNIMAIVFALAIMLGLVSSVWALGDLAAPEGAAVPLADTATKVAYTDSNIIGGSIYYNPQTGAIVDCDTNVISCVIPSEINGVAITSIGSSAFSSTDLVRITIPESVLNISNNAFHSSKIQSVSIPASVTSIGDVAFGYCRSLKSVEILGACELGNSVFKYCSGLEIVSMPRLVSFGNDAFYECNALYDIVLPEGITAIPNYAFYNCSSLQKINIPSTVKKIGSYAFRGTDLTSGIVLPNGVQSIGEFAFYDSNLSGQLLIPDSVTDLGICVFGDCNLSSVTIPGSVTNIPERAFYGTDSLLKIIIEDGVQSIGKQAFYATSTNELNRVIYVPASLQYILDSAFANLYKHSTVKEVYYAACEGSWNNIIVGANNEYFTNATIHYQAHNNVLTNDDVYHWSACSYCGLVSESKEYHSFRSSDSICDVCGYNANATPPHTHTLTYGTDTHVHWDKCDECGYTGNVTEHDLVNGACAVCGYAGTDTVNGPLGDLNGDGEVNVQDGVKMQRILAGLE